MGSDVLLFFNRKESCDVEGNGEWGGEWDGVTCTLVWGVWCGVCRGVWCGVCLGVWCGDTLSRGVCLALRWFRSELLFNEARLPTLDKSNERGCLC